jgi:2-keto-3-deoxy-L-rhamnonate aldolase RhmA
MKRLALSADKVAIGTFVKTDSPQVIEVLGTTALDFAVIDAEHAPFDRQSLDRMLLAGRAADLALLVRVPDFGPISIQAALDLDAAGILVPHVGSESDARTVVARARFRGGERGLSVAARFGGYGTLPRNEAIARGDATLVLCQIESERAVQAADAIAAVPGVHALFIGRADLGLSMGLDDPLHPRVLEAARHSVDMALRAGKVAAMNAATLQEAARYAAWGVSCFVIGSDQSLLRAAAQEAADGGGERLRAALVVPA